MREKTAVLILVLGAVSAVSGTIAAYAAMSGKSAQACALDPSAFDGEDEQWPVLQRASLPHRTKKLLP